MTLPSAGAEQDGPAPAVSRFPTVGALLGVFSVVALIAMGLFARFSYAEQRKSVETFLAAIAQIKAEQVSDYRDDLLTKALVLQSQAGLIGTLADLLDDPQKDERVEALAKLRVLQRDSNLAQVLLVNAAGETVLALTQSPEQPAVAVDRELVQEALRRKTSCLSPTLNSSREAGANLQTATPILDRDGNALGAVVMVFPGQSGLYKMLSAWPVPSSTGEIVLFERQNEELVFLSPVRKTELEPVSTRFSLTLERFMSVRGALETQGLLEAIDYHGDPVVSYLMPVSGSSWMLGVKMDVSEAFVVWRLQLALLASAALVGLLLLAAIGWSLHQQDRLRRTKALWRAEQAARQSQARFDEVSEHSRTFAWESDLQGTFTFVSPVATQILGYQPEELVGQKTFYDLHPEEGREACKERNREIFAVAGSYRNFENPAVAKSGELVWLSTTALPIMDPQGKVLGYRGLDTDITEQKRHQAELALLGAAIEQAGEAVVITDAEGTIEFVNRGFTQLTGYTAEEAMGQNPRLIKSGMQDTAFYERMWQTLTSGQTWEGQIVNRHKNGLLYTEVSTITPVLNEHGRITNYVAVKRDVSEYLRLSEQLGQAQKLESIGRLAGGIAHDFNNLVMGIQGFAELGLEKLPAGHPARLDLQEIQAISGRTASLTKQLLAFARQQPIAPKVLDLNATLEELLAMLRRLIGEDITLTWTPGAELWSVEADSGQLDQVLTNLVVNARDAISGVGTIALETRNVTLSLSACASIPEARTGDFVVIRVSDSGAGMTPEVLEHIFDPFFTTKAVGKGTGLGLAMVYGVVKQNGGFLSVTSAEGQGSCFELYFPRSCRLEPALHSASGRVEERPGKETILLAEDEESVRNITARFLERLGYHVLSTESPAQALALVEGYEGTIDLLLTDVIMPGATGRDLAIALQALRPQVKVVYMSGYTGDVIAERGVLRSEVHFLQKPFTKDELARVVRLALESETAIRVG